MLCQVVFPNVRRFSGFGDFLPAVKKLVARPAGGCGARFFLFGEDLFGTLKDAGCPLIVPHSKVVSFIPSLQRALGPSDFVVFSVYASVGASVLNAVYLVGQRHWRFDFKRNLVLCDELVLDKESLSMQNANSLLNAKSPRCVRAGGLCVKNIHLFICADIDLLRKVRFAERSLVLFPASSLSPAQISAGISRLSGSGRIFINDPSFGSAWAIHFGRGAARAAPEPIPLSRRSSVSVDFELK